MIMIILCAYIQISIVQYKCKIYWILHANGEAVTLNAAIMSDPERVL